MSTPPAGYHQQVAASFADGFKDLEADKINEIREEIQAKRPETTGDESQDVNAQYEALDAELKKIEDTKRAAAEMEDSQD